MVDYKNDMFETPGHYMSSIMEKHDPFPTIPIYALWLQHEVSRASTSSFYHLHKQGWYERRMEWLIELMDVMEISEEGIAKEIADIHVTPPSAEKIDASRLAASFLHSVNVRRAVKLEK